MVQEWDESVFNVSLRELKMVSWEGHKLDLTGFIQSFDSNEIIVVEVSSVQRKDVSLLVKRLEPCGLLWVDDGISVEHNKHSSVKIGELSSSEIVVVSVI